MEDSAAKDQSSASGRSTSRLLRYPLRSAGKPKEEKPPLADSSNTKSASKRGRVPSSISKSVAGLDFSGKEKPAKPPRRLSVPTKSNISQAPKSTGNVTPISGSSGAKWSSGNKGKSDTPLSDVSKSSQRKRFSVLSSSSYWLSQIRLSESAAKHLISLGFFKLALEAKCEPTQRMIEELKSYVHRHNLSEFSESVKALLESYKISENLEQSSQGSETCSEVPAEGKQLSDNDEVNSSTSSVTEAEKQKPKPDVKISTETKQKTKIAKDGALTTNNSAKNARKSVPKNKVDLKSGHEERGRSTQKKSRKPSKPDAAQDKDKVKKGKSSTLLKQDAAAPLNSPPDEALKENIETMVEVNSVVEV